MNSFFIRNLRRDSDLRSNVIPSLTREKSLMFLSTFIVCILVEVSKGDTNGTELANWKKFFFEEKRKSAREARR